MHFHWKSPEMADVHLMANITMDEYGHELLGIIQPDGVKLCGHIAEHILFPKEDALLSVAKDVNNNVCGWALASAGSLPYSSDKVWMVELIHLSFTSLPRARVKMIYQLLGLYEYKAKMDGYTMIMSSSIRSDTQAFMKIHQKLGYTISGAVAVKRIG